MVNLLSLPLLTQLYAPQAFGVLAIFSSFAWILAVIATCQAEHLIITMRSKRRANALTVGIIVLVSLFSLLLAVIFEFVVTNFSQFATLKEIDNISILLGLAVFFIGNNQALRCYATYTGKFKAHGVSSVFASIGTVGVSIGYAVFVDALAPATGLILGQVCGLVLSLIPFLIITDVSQVLTNGSTRLIPLIMRMQMKNLPILLVTHLSKTVHTRLPVLIVGSVSGGAAGAYAMAERLVGIPARLLGQSIGHVFRHRYKSYVDSPILSMTRPRIVITVSFISSLLCCGTFIYFAEWFVSFLLGDDWIVAVPFLQIIAVMEMMNLVFYCVEDVAVIRGTYHYRMLWQLSQLLVILGGYAYVSLINVSIEAEHIVTILCLTRILFVLYDLSKTWRNVKTSRL